MGSYNFISNNRMSQSEGGQSPERRLWRAVLNQALEDGFGMYTTFMCDYEKHDAEFFINVRTASFDKLCERADVDPDQAWKAVQRFKLIKTGIVKATTKRDFAALAVFNRIKSGRSRMRSSRRVAHGYVNGR